MPLFEPFAGVRYDPEHVRLVDVIAPPYDVIGPSQRAELQARSRYNSVRIELPDDVADGDRYVAAARRYREWRADGVLRQDAEPAFYGYRMAYDDLAGRRRHTVGVIGALRLEPPGTAGIFPHEQTTPKAKSDRLQLLRATGVNTSPIWGLSLAEGLSKALGPAGSSQPVPDEEGVEHQLWAITDPEAVAWIGDAVSGSPVVIADGHHRFETALNYQRQEAERPATSGGGACGGGAFGGGARGADAVMALVVELADEQLSVRAIHRVIRGLPPDADLAVALSDYFDLIPTGESGVGLLHEMDRRDSLALVTRAGTWLLLPTPETVAAAGQDLASSQLAVALAGLPDHELVYEHRLDSALAAVAGGEAQGAVLLRPVTVAQIASTGRGGARMPPKTTFFWPKPRTGLVFREIEP